MPRTVRKLSQYNVYHVVLKGINSQQIFYDESDYYNFLNILKDCCGTYNVTVAAYCLMSNHVHLMLKSDENNIAYMFKSFGASYVYRYNRKYGRTGALFNGRYYSKAINDEGYFSAVLKYIHYNPVTAKICKELSDYRWSSYNSYKDIINGVRCKNNHFIDDSYLFSVIDKSDFDMIHISKEEDFIDFFAIQNDINRVNDTQLNEYVKKLINNFGEADTAARLLSYGYSKLKVSKLLGIDRRKL